MNPNERQFKSSQIASSSAATTMQAVDKDSLDILAKAETRFRGQVPENPQQHADATQVWLEDKPNELGGPSGPEPTRFGDWERKGRCFDF